MLFVPRAVLFVPNMVLKAGFYPVQKLLGVLDEYKVIERVDAFLHNDAHTAGVLPTFSFQTGYGPTFGATIFHEDLFGHGEKVSLNAGFGGVVSQGYQLLFSADRLRGTRLWLEGRLGFTARPGQLFYGLGDPPTGVVGSNLDPRAGAIETRYATERYLTLLRVGVTLGKPGALTKLGVTVSHNFRDGLPDESSNSVETVYDTSKIAGFDEVFNTLEIEANLIVDTRNRNAQTSSGFALEAFGGGAVPIEGFTYWHYGVEASAYIDLYGGSRVLLLRGAVEAVDGDDAEIPFVELPRLGGAYDLRGYIEDRFRDKRAAVFSAEYHWPIHELVMGELFIDAGRVGRTYDDVFGGDAWEQWRLGYGGGVIITTKKSVMFRLDLAYGDSLQFFFSTDLARAFKGREKEL